MRHFDILDRNTPIHQNTLLEASAGTGKTFSIEHLVVRLLITGENPPVLSRLLVVTFTRAATRDLKMRIRQNMETALQNLRNHSSAFDYLNAILEKGEAERLQAERRLESALYCFDQAQIYTIHGFCLRMLKDHGFAANIRVDLPESENPLSKSEVLELIKDFFRTDFNKYSLAEIKLVIGKLSVEKFQEQLLHLLINSKEIERQYSYQEAFSLFQERMRLLKREGFTANDILQRVNLYKGLKPENQMQLEGFAKLLELEEWTEKEFDWLILDQLSILKLFDKSKLRSKQTDVNRFYRFKELLLPLIHEGVILAKIASDCQQRFYHYLEKSEKYRFDDLLQMMKNGLSHPQFKARVQAQFSLAIIDEFQDTDPVQWDIFRDLFLQAGHHLYLVGDPKQSIYAFRQADIYTYLRAQADIGPQNAASLTTNYRSQPSLIRALNALFSKPGFLALPKLKSYLPYREIKPAPKAADYPFKDGKGSVHVAWHECSGKFSLEPLEQTEFFPFAAQEIKRLAEQENFHYSQIAILVADRYQAARLMTFLQKWQIPAVNQKQQSLLESPAYTGMKDLIQALLNPKDLSSVKLALGGGIFGWTHHRIKDVDLIEVLRLFIELHQRLFTEGFGSLFKKLLSAKFFNAETTLAEQILSRVEGDQFYSDLNQIAELLIESRAQPEQLPLELELLVERGLDDDPSIQRRFAPNANAVKLLTIHSSKGLEFDVVIALGLIKRVKISESFIPVQKEGKTKLIPVIDEESEAYIDYCEEMNAEKMRQLYVALTRAKYRVYIPLATPLSEEMMNCSPMDLFLAHFTPASLRQLAESGEIGLTELNGNYTIGPVKLEETAPVLTAPEAVTLLLPAKKIASFSLLANQTETGEYERIKLELSNEIKSPHTLPAGSHTGNLLHLILEKIPLAQAFEWTLPEFERYLAPFVNHSPFKGWAEVLSEMLYNAMTVPLLDSFALNEIDPAKTCREMEFLYEETLYPITHMKGFVDLVFQHKGLYYLLDWKSNWLGHSCDDYQRQHLEKCMLKHDYFLQADIYKTALKKYLALVDDRPFDQIFGGVFYVFLRGLAPGRGIYHLE